MAMTYPEGECFFKRSVISNSFYNANDPEEFYSNFMIEYLWNVPSQPEFYDDEIPTHPRSDFSYLIKFGNMKVCGT